MRFSDNFEPDDDEDVDPVLVEWAAELSSKVQAGERVDFDAYARTHPDRAEHLRDLLPAIALMADLGASASHETRSGGVPARHQAPPYGILGDYRILREIGRGGMGVVYEAVQLSLGRRVALKVLPVAAALDPRQFQRFQIEAQAAAHLNHAHIVPVYAVGYERDVPFYAMQLIDGHSLAELIRDDRRLEGLDSVPGDDDVTLAFEPAAPPDSADRLATTLPASSAVRGRERSRMLARLACQAAEALEHAHESGILHRDIKPANLLIDARGNLWVTDFGLARFHEEGDLTISGDVLGTLRYMSPEQARGRRVEIDGRTDVYSLGVTLYEALTLRPAFDDRDRQALLRRILHEDPPPPRTVDPAVPAVLETIVLKAIAKDPADRYESARAMADDLGRFLDDRPILARRPGLPERIARLARRNLAAVGSAAAVLVVALAVLGGMSLAYNARLVRANNDMRAAMERAQGYAAEARRQRALADEHARLVDRQFRASRLKLAFQEWEAGRVERAQELMHALGTGPGTLGFAEAYLREQSRRDVSLLLGHDVPVRRVVLSPDGRTLASGDFAGKTILWDLPSGLARATLPGPVAAVCVLQFSPDGRRLVIGANFEDRSIATAVRLWDTSAGKLLAEIPGRSDSLRAAEFAPDGRSVAALFDVTSDQSVLSVWDLGHASAQPRLAADIPQVVSFAYSPDARHLTTIHPDGRIVVRDAADGRPEATFPIRGRVRSLAYGQDSRTIYLGGDATPLDAIDLTTGRRTELLSGDNPSHRMLALVGGARPHAVFDTEADIRVSDLTTGRGWIFPRPVIPLPVAALSPDRRFVVHGGGKEPATLIELDAPGKPRVFGGATGNIHDFTFADGGRTVAIASGPPVRLWHHDRPAAPPQPEGHAAEAWALQFSPDSETLASAGDDHLIKLWDRRTRRLKSTLRGHAALVTSLAFLPDNKTLASGSFDRTVRLWDTASGRAGAVLRGHTNTIRALAASPDGRTLASAGSDTTIRLWDTADGRGRGVLTGHTLAVRTLAFAPEGGLLASAGNDLTVRLWDLNASRPVRVLPGPYSCSTVAFSPDGTTLAVARNDGGLALWDMRTAERRMLLSGHEGEVRCLAFSPDGLVLASGGADKAVVLWDPVTGQDLMRFADHKHWVNKVAFSPDGRSLASCGHDGAVVIHSLGER